jgi:two-component system chemotaxis response regulator CheY
MALIDLLSGYGMFDLVEASDGEAAWMLLEGGLRPVICFCDVRMPRMSGIDLLARIKESPHLKDLPFVLVSSASDRDTVLQAVKLGAVGYILKPLQPADARAHLDKIFKLLSLDRVAESPADTLKRLNIGPERLSAYLVAFSDQIEVAEHDLARQLDSGATEEARTRLDALRTACMTLGLWHAASQLDAVRHSVVLDPAAINGVLEQITQAVRTQAARLKGAPRAAA